VTRKESQHKGSQERSFTITKAVLYTGFLWVLLFGGIEVTLGLFGVKTLVERQDLSRGFSGLVPVFVKEGQRMRTRSSLRGEVFNDQFFSVIKPPESLRIFTVGGSSAFGFPSGASASFSGILQDVLTNAYPDLTIEAINAAGVSYAMHRLNLVVQEIVEYAPDIIIVYSGHNEFIEHEFYRALRERNDATNRLINTMARLRISGALHSLLKKENTKELSAGDRFGMVVDRADKTWDVPAEKAAVVESYRDGLAQLIRVARNNGSKVIVTTVPSNLRDWRPQKSVVGHFMDDSARTAWQEAFVSGQSSLGAAEYHDAIAALESASLLAPEHADTHFLLGRAYEELGQWEQSRQSYQLAVDYDASPIRGVSEIDRAIREVASQEGALLVDIEKVFAENSAHGLIGFELIEDYVHPSSAGHALIAWNLWRAIAKAGWIDGPMQVERHVFDRILAARPTVSTNENAVWHYNQGVILENQDHFAQAIAKYREAIEIDPDYWAALQNLGLLLRQQRDPDQALQIMRRAAALRPDAPDSLLPLGDLLRSTGHLDAALDTFRRLAADSNNAAAQLGIGQVYERMGMSEAAAAEFKKAIRLEPESAKPHILLAHLMIRNRDVQTAEIHITHALRLDPIDADAHNALGVLNSALNKFDEAAVAFAQAIELNPARAHTYHNLSRVLLLQGELNLAQSNLDIAARIDPQIPLLHFTQGEILARHEMWRDAATEYQLALDRQPDFGPARQAHQHALDQLEVSE
jgi:tetratricopeptide (TPR) repeat protein